MLVSVKVFINDKTVFIDQLTIWLVISIRSNTLTNVVTVIKNIKTDIINR